jgi:diguanylate cyclase (GGDEF)-like protein
MAYSLRRSTNFAVMVLDLDNLTPLNDKHGHFAGDALLIETANRLKQSVRDVDTVARFGGDEFVVVLGELDADYEVATSQANALAEKIRTALAEPYLLSVTKGSKDHSSVSVAHRCTASVGVSIGMGHQLAMNEVLKRADGAMYRAKEAGRNQVKIAERLA